MATRTVKKDAYKIPGTGGYEGPVVFTINGVDHVLRDPTIGELQALDEAFLPIQQHASADVEMLAEALEATPESIKELRANALIVDPAEAMGRKHERQQLVLGWWLDKVFPALADRQLLDVDRATLPVFLTQGTVATAARDAWSGNQ